METVDLNSVDGSTAIGQVTLLVLAFGAFLTPIWPLLANRKSKKSNYATLVEELNRVKKERDFLSRMVSNLSDWQMTARQLIYLYRVELVSNGAKPKKRLLQMREELDRIDEIDPYAEFLKEESDE